MSRWSLKFAGFVLLLAFGVFYGVSLASSGIERIHGPYAAGTEPPLSALPAETAESPAPKPTQTAAPPAKAPPVYHLRESDPALLERAAHKTGALLQILADHGIRAVVGLFEKILD